VIRAEIPVTVHSVADEHGHLVLLNVATGRWHVLNRTGAEFYEHLRSVADIGKASEALITRYRGVPPERIHRDVNNLVNELASRDLIEIHYDGGRDPAGVPMVEASIGAPQVPLRYRLAALVAFPLTILLLRLPFRHSMALVGRLKRTGNEAGRREALSILIAIRKVNRRYPGRVACLEQSLSAVIAAALLGRRVDWCLGFAIDPYSFHAWIEVAGHPVVHPLDEAIPPTYRRVLRA
jgi:hypothetical protein